jgi:acetyl esterase
MTTTLLTRYDIDVEDVEYLRHGNKSLLARIYQPRGSGPFPLLVDVHGGAWCEKDRTRNTAINEPLARSGVVMIAVDFRMPPDDAGYPASIADVNYAIRWCKSRAAQMRVRRDRVGVLGSSSGGHQAMLAAMRPDDPRYAILPLAAEPMVDATVRCAVLCWPVIDPLGRYYYAKQLKTDGKSKAADHWITCHEQYWKDEAAMAEGSPALTLERGEPVQMPPVLYLQGTKDEAHPRPNLERFVASYRKAGGRLELHLFEGMGQAFINNHPDASASLAAIEKIIAFVHREMH